MTSLSDFSTPQAPQAPSVGASTASPPPQPGDPKFTPPELLTHSQAQDKILAMRQRIANGENPSEDELRYTVQLLRYLRSGAVARGAESRASARAANKGMAAGPPVSLGDF